MARRPIPPGLRRDSARLRRSEQDKALHMLDVPLGSTIRLHIPDGKVADHEDELSEVLEDLIEPGDLIVAPWVHDWHPTTRRADERRRLPPARGR